MPKSNDRSNSSVDSKLNKLEIISFHTLLHPLLSLDPSPIQECLYFSVFLIFVYQWAFIYRILCGLPADLQIAVGSGCLLRLVSHLLKTRGKAMKRRQNAMGIQSLVSVKYSEDGIGPIWIREDQCAILISEVISSWPNMENCHIGPEIHIGPY